MVLVLSRGGYCPKDRRQAEGVVQLHRELEVGYCRLVTISTDSIVEANEYRRSWGPLAFPTTRGAPSKRIWTSPSIPTRPKTRQLGRFGGFKHVYRARKAANDNDAALMRRG
jgi:hypothetical protein